jgi:hypothetical protein
MIGYLSSPEARTALCRLSSGSAATVNAIGGVFTKLLIHFNGDLLDAAKGHTLVKSASIGYSSTVKKFGSGGLASDTSGHPFFQTDLSADFAIAGGDFSLDFWVMNLDGQGMPTIELFNGGSVYLKLKLKDYTSSTLILTPLTGDPYTSTGVSMAHGAWTHLAVCKVGNVLLVYKDGVVASTVTLLSSTALDTAATVGLRMMSVGVGNTVHLDEVRFCNGIAMAPLGVPTAEYADADGALTPSQLNVPCAARAALDAKLAL